MGTFSIWHWAVIIFIIGFLVVPVWQIMKKTGYSGWLSLIALVPIVNIFALWIFAFAEWPALKKT